MQQQKYKSNRLSDVFSKEMKIASLNLGGINMRRPGVAAAAGCS